MIDERQVILRLLNSFLARCYIFTFYDHRSASGNRYLQKQKRYESAFTNRTRCVLGKVRVEWIKLGTQTLERNLKKTTNRCDRVN